jgi:glycosyltransferase involved in cell wall biosynthesis
MPHAVVMRTAEHPRIGVITPSFNQGCYIRETIDSVLGQQYPNLEYWVIDGGSTDDTIEILKSYGPAINWISENDGGQADALNKGLKRVAAEIVAFVNSDDLYLPGSLSSVGRHFALHPDTMWLTGDHFIIDHRGRKIQSFVVSYKRILRRHPSFKTLAVANYIVQPSTFWRRELMDEIGFFDTSLHYCFDYDFWLRAILKHSPYVASVPLSLFRIHGASKGGSRFADQFAEEYRVLCRHTTDKMLRGLHRLHGMLIVLAYRIIKG